jgi:predicted heme/steroid binding protein
MEDTRKRSEEWYTPLDGILDKLTAWYAWKESREIALEDAAKLAEAYDSKNPGLPEALRSMKAPHH